MYLKELTINGFKSFAKKGELEFGSSITAIVGPNGSGKSNVAEAFRFVLGEQSPSRMRGKKGEDLIWSGSENASRANRASVSIVLDNEKKIFPLDFSEITIERVVNRDGTNEYFVNGSRTRLRDVHELLAAANIGSTGHHIISQGEADRILSSNPRERREMIEDALGLKVYQFKKQESEKKLQKTRENVGQVESLRKEVAPHLKFLEKQVKKIERSLALKEELKEFYAEYLKREDVYLSRRYDTLVLQKNEPQESLSAIEKELEREKQKLQEAEKDDKRDALVALENDMDGVRKERQELAREIGQLEGKITFLESRIEASRQKTQREDSAPIPYEDFVKAADAIAVSARDAENETDVGVVKRILREVVETLSALRHRASEEQSVNDREDETMLENLRSEKEACEEKLRAVEGQEHALQQKGETLRTSIEAEHSASREAEREVFSLMNERRELEAALSHVDESLRTVARDREEWKREVQEAVALIRSAAAAYQTYEIVEEGRKVSEEELMQEPRSRQQERRRELEKMKIRLEELGDGGAEDVLKEYNDVKERDEFLMHEIEDLNQSIEKLEGLIDELNDRLNEQFALGIEKISAEFDRFFTLMFGGGSAKLLRVKPSARKQKKEEFSDMDDDMPLTLSSEDESESVEEGVEIDVKLPNKRVRGLDMLSGGERALTSIALIFAMSQVNPPLFVILDETDAALDEANSRRYGDMIEALSERSQLILITHNRETMGRAGVLYGVTMGSDGISKLLSVKFEEAVTVAK